MMTTLYSMLPSRISVHFPTTTLAKICTERVVLALFKFLVEAIMDRSFEMFTSGSSYFSQKTSINQSIQFVSYTPCTIGTLVPAATVSITGKQECGTYNEALEAKPMDLFGVSANDFFEPYGDVHAILNRMDHQLRALTQHVEQEANQAAPTEGSKSGSLVPRISSDSLDFLKDAYQLGEDGRVHFKVRFDLQGYGPDDIKVSTSDNGVTVHAKKVVQTDRALSSREYSRTIYLPKSVDKKQLECHLTEDGVLMLEAPVKAADYKSITFDRDRQVSIKPHSETEVGQKRKSEDALAIQPTGILGPTVLKDDKSGGEKLHVEIPVDPEFSADDLCVRMDANRVVVSGKKKTVDKTGNSSSTFVKEFSRSYDVPQTVDTFSVNAQLQGGKLLVEAPLLRPSISQ
ncbi:Major egg antigen [Clonorchis sinensis]|uniref:Major egg antigen n=1 Tax=Clonorchis sinensis TaxID=79923 RepID=A0A8T1MLD6_CLOSI|nr:Major egg antigen [Clonorchis sinensis]